MTTSTSSTHPCFDGRKLIPFSRVSIRVATLLAAAALLSLTFAGCSSGTSTEPTTSVEEEAEPVPDTDSDADTGRIAIYPDWMSQEMIAHIEKTCPNYQVQLYSEISELPDGFPELPVNTDEWTPQRAQLSASTYKTPTALWLTLGEIETTYNETVEAYTAAGWTILPEAEKKEQFEWTTEFTHPSEELNHNYTFLIFSCDGIVTISLKTQPSR